MKNYQFVSVHLTSPLSERRIYVKFNLTAFDSVILSFEKLFFTLMSHFVLPLSSMASTDLVSKILFFFNFGIPRTVPYGN